MSGDRDRLWQEEARAAGGDTLVEIITEIRDNQVRAIERMDEHERRFEHHLKEGFPAGDPGGHRRYHEAQIAKIEEMRRLRAAILEKSISGIVWGCFIGLAIAVWEWFKRQVHGG